MRIRGFDDSTIVVDLPETQIALQALSANE